MSSYHQVKAEYRLSGRAPIHGINDPRVDYWHSSKMAARLMASSTSGKPVLLDLDYEAGHGVGSTKLQRQRTRRISTLSCYGNLGHPDFSSCEQVVR